MCLRVSRGGITASMLPELGADLALTTTVHKVSNLILSITLALREASPNGATRAVHSAEIRGNTDESWERGLRWLLRNRLLAEQASQPSR